MDGIGEREIEREREQFEWHQTGLEQVTNVVVVTRVRNVTNWTSENISHNDVQFAALTFWSLQCER